MKYTKTIVLSIICCVIAIWGGITWSNYRSPDLTPAPQDIVLGSSEMELHFLLEAPQASFLPNIEDDFVRQTIESKFNIRLKITAMQSGYEYDQHLSSLLIANDPPDMWLGLGEDGGAGYALNNALAGMSHYITSDTMPNYFKYWISEKELREFQFHNKFMRAPIPFDRNSYRAYYIRKDWLDRLDLNIPATYEEYLDVLHAFTYDDPDGNGQDDTFGFTTAGNGSEISTDWPEYVKNGLLYPAYYDNGRFVDMQLDHRIEDVVTDILDVLEAGVVEPNWFLNKDDDVINKAVRGRIGVVLGDTKQFAFDANPDSLQVKSQAINPQANWVPFNPFENQPLRVQTSPKYPFMYSNITAGLEPVKLKITTEILNWLASEEGFLLTHYGLEGKHYIRQGNKIIVIPEVVEQEIKDKGDFLKIWSFFTPNTPEAFDLIVEDPRKTLRDDQIFDFITGIPVHEGVGTTLTPPLNESIEAMRLRQNELQVQMLITEKSSQRWPEYRKEIMDHYNGKKIMEQYETKIRSSLNRYPSNQ